MKWERIFSSKRRQRIFYFTATLVVFLTTYLLVLPAITIDEDTAIEDPSISSDTFTQKEEQVNVLETVADPFVIEQEREEALNNNNNNNNTENNEYHDALFGSELTYISDPNLRSRIIVVGNAAIRDGAIGVADDSNCGSRVDLLAPGDPIYSTIAYSDGILLISSDYGYMSGTSMAAPQVSGVAAVIWSLNSSLTGPEIKQIICDTATGTYAYRFNQPFSRSDVYPMLDAYAAVEAAITIKLTSETDVQSVQDDQQWKAAYLNELETNREGIINYNNRTYAAVERPIAVCDVCGDSTPELLYITCQSYDYPYCVFRIITFEDGAIRLLYENQYWDSLVASGSHYCLFQIENDNSLYYYDSYGDSSLTYILDRFMVNDTGGLEPVQLLTMHREYLRDGSGGVADRYEDTNGPIDSETFSAQWTSIMSQRRRIVLSGHSENEQLLVDQSGIDHIAMNYGEAIAFLGGDIVDGTNLSDYIGSYSAQASWTNEVSCRDVLTIVAADNDTVEFNIDFYRLWGPNKTVTANSGYDGAFYFNESDQRFSGTLIFGNGNIVMTIDDTPNFYGTTSSVDFLGEVHVFSPDSSGISHS